MSPSRKISFNFDIEKFVNAIAYFASKVKDLDKYKTVKLLYLADRLHLIKYARPIVGDRYYRAPYGPIPDIALHIISDAIDDIKASWTDSVKQYIKIDREPKYPILKGNKPADLEVFSESELETLDIIIKEYGNKSFDELKRLTHKQAVWERSREGEEIDYRLFFEEDPDAKNILELVELEQEDRDLFRKLNE